MVPFSKYPSWCTSSMSPYLDLRWQMKGLCRTSMSTSASGSFPPLTEASMEEPSSTTSNMPTHPTSGKFKKNTRRKHKTAAAEAASPLRGSEWRCCRNLSSDWLLSAKAPPTNIHLITRIHSHFIGWCKNKMFFFYFLLYIIVTSRTTTKKSVTFHGSEHMDKSTISCLK